MKNIEKRRKVSLQSNIQKLREINNIKLKEENKYLKEKFTKSENLEFNKKILMEKESKRKKLKKELLLKNKELKRIKIINENKSSVIKKKINSNEEPFKDKSSMQEGKSGESRTDLKTRNRKNNTYERLLNSLKLETNKINNLCTLIEGINKESSSFLNNFEIGLEDKAISEFFNLSYINIKESESK